MPGTHRADTYSRPPVVPGHLKLDNQNKLRWLIPGQLLHNYISNWNLQSAPRMASQLAQLFLLCHSRGQWNHRQTMPCVTPVGSNLNRELPAVLAMQIIKLI